MAEFTRRSAWELETADPGNVWDPYTLAYAKAVAEMQTRAADDPTSWTFQAAMHGTYATPALPTWNQCQHGTWYFLPWHRMYCYWFERIVRSIVVAQGGPADWALPFWNYSESQAHAALPPAFREKTYDPDGSGTQVPNPLYIPARGIGYNEGRSLPASATSLAALSSTNFTGAPLPGFGGVVTGFSHEPTRFGLLEQVPHNIVHVLVGGNARGECQGGWMSDPNCAAEDPIFWLHHSNIDRLWDVWNTAGNTNPTTDAAWTGFEFHFWDENGTEQVMTPGDVESLSQLDYTYEAQPAAQDAPAAREGLRMTAPQPPAGDAAPGGTGDSPVRDAPRLLAANDEEVELTGGRTDVRVPVARQAHESLRRAADPGDASLRHVYLNVEGLSAVHTPGTAWEVHLTLPDGSTHVVGVVTFFGFKEQLQGDHGLGPMAHTFEITDLVGRAGGAEDLAVAFVPIGGEDVAEGETVHGAPRIGRVSISAH